MAFPSYIFSHNSIFFFLLLCVCHTLYALILTLLCFSCNSLCLVAVVVVLVIIGFCLCVCVCALQHTICLRNYLSSLLPQFTSPSNLPSVFPLLSHPPSSLILTTSPTSHFHFLKASSIFSSYIVSPSHLDSHPPTSTGMSSDVIVGETTLHS